MPRQSAGRGRLALLLGLVALLGLSFAPRWILHARTPDPGGESWIVADPDSLYHARRVERVLAEGPPVAERDAFINYPDGAAIPWPPYYDALLSRLLAPFAPEEESARHAYLERGVASLPLVFGVLTTWLAFLGGCVVAGRSAGFAAGVWQALCVAAIVYSHSGNGDHHAFVSMLSGALLLLFSWALANRRLERSCFAWGGGALAGVLAGVALGSWVASLLYVIQLELVLGWLLFRHARRPRAGLAAFGLAFHASALLAILPAVLSSPWKDEFPWMVVNLSWFHPAYLALGGLVFVPLFFLRAEGGAHRRYPWLVGAALAALAGVSWLLEAGPVPGILEGFAWVSRADQFMSGVAESRPLIGSGATPGELFLYLGWGIPLLPLAWLGALYVVLRRGDEALLPWVVAVPLLALQAAHQARFAEALAMPAGVLIGWGLATAARTCLPRLPSSFAAAAVVAIAAVAQGDTWSRMATELGGNAPPMLERRHRRAFRELCTWIEANTEPGDWSVLANWPRGHEIEWAAQRPSVATNFGSYVGEAGFRAPALCFLNEDPVAAEAVMASRRARYCLVTCFFTDTLPVLVRAGEPGWEGRYYHLDAAENASLRPAWFRTIGAQLLFGGLPHPQAGLEHRLSLDFLRLVHVSPKIMRHTPLAPWAPTTPYGWVWERVAGARLEAELPPGEALEVEIEVHYTSQRGEPVQVVRWRNRTIADQNGRARLRVPYATRAPNGSGAVRSARWRAGAREGELSLDDLDILEGRTVVLP